MSITYLEAIREAQSVALKKMMKSLFMAKILVFLGEHLNQPKGCTMSSPTEY